MPVNSCKNHRASRGLTPPWAGRDVDCSVSSGYSGTEAVNLALPFAE